MITRSLFPGLLTVALFLAAGCGGGADSSQKDKLVIYTAAVADTMEPKVELFKKWAKETRGVDVDVDWVYASTSAGYARMEAERENPQADILDTVSERAVIAAEKGLTHPYKVPQWDKIPNIAKDPDGQWWSPSFGVYGIVYNTDIVSDEEVPKDWVDVLDPKWKGQIIVRDPTQSGTGGTILLSFMAVWGPEKGKDFLLRLDNQVGGRYHDNSTQTVLDVARGASKIALWNEAYTLHLKYEKDFSNLGLVYPKSWVAVGRLGVLIPKGAPHLKAAEMWMDFLASPENAAYTMKRYGRPLLTEGVPKDAWSEWMKTYPTEKLPAVSVDWAKLAGLRAKWLNMWSNEIKGRGAAYVAANPKIPEYTIIDDYIVK